RVETRRIADLDHGGTEKPVPRGELVQAPRARSPPADTVRGCACAFAGARRGRDAVRHVDHEADCKQAPVERNMPSGRRVSPRARERREALACSERRVTPTAAITP